MAMSSGFMCYIKQGNVQKGVICSLYTHQVWNEDLTSRNITLEFDIASDLSMCYLVFAVSANNYEWEVLHVQDSQNNAVSQVTIPESYSGSVKFGIKLYDNPPTVGSVLHVGFDYVVTGGIDVAGTRETDIQIFSDSGYENEIMYYLGGNVTNPGFHILSSNPSISDYLYIKAPAVATSYIDYDIILVIYSGTSVVSQIKLFHAENEVSDERYIASLPTDFPYDTPVTLMLAYGTYAQGAVPMIIAEADGTITFHKAISSGGSYAVGDTVTIGGIECVIAYDAGSEQSWGRYILCEKHDLNYYEPDLGTGGVDESYSGKQWGFYGISTGVTDTAIGTGKNNTDQLISQNDNDDNTLWYYVNQHRFTTGRDWHVPSKDELNILYENKTTIGNFTISSSYRYYWSSSEQTSAYAWFQNFSDGSQNITFRDTKLLTTRRVRCVLYATDADLPSEPSTETIQITCATPDATIRYTLDGNNPTESSTLYEGQFEVTPPITVKARAYKTGMLASDVATHEVEAPVVPKLPTPVVGKGGGQFGQYVKLENYQEYPSGTSFQVSVYYLDELIKQFTCSIEDVDNDGKLTDDPYESLAFDNAQVTAKCDGYEDSYVGYYVLPVPMALPDGSVLFYDRGSEYGEYHIGNDGYPVRDDGATDDGSAESTNWRYLICDSANLSERRQWGTYGVNEGLTLGAIGYGLPNTETLLSKYDGDSTCIWQLVQNKRDATGGKKWFVPSEDELNIVYQNKDTIVNAGGGSFPTDDWYWSSSERDSYRARVQKFSDGTQANGNKGSTYRCRLIRRV